ncbi:MAG: UDP-glucose/GDP-mannose dehydrogenase family protein [Candidatus Harrisonbacteria bacterium]|nr:UDP-glucose/GDP-mannose dehydrogenase family protein [Candidatus Harrisonbacteria bacterium]
MQNPKIGIVGVGWVGAQLKRYFEEFRGYKSGEDLFAYDIDPKKCVGDLNKADIIFLTVPTPRDPQTGVCDTSIVDSAIKKIPGEKIIVIKSTVPPGTTERLQKEHPQHKMLFNPEFLSEKTAWHDMLRPDRQIVGFTEKSMDAAHLVLSLLPKAPFMSPWGVSTYQQTRIAATEAELIKYAGNVYFAQKVNWANALAAVSEKLGANYENVRKGMSADHRIGDSHLDVTHGGYRGFGGYCFPKDLSAFMAFAKEQGLHNVHDLLKAAWDFNGRLLESQGLTYDDVSRHIDEFKQS